MTAPRSDPIPLHPADRQATEELDSLFDAIVDGLRRDVRRLRAQIERFRRAYQKRPTSDDEATRSAFRRLRQLQLVGDHIESSAAFLLGSGIAPDRRSPEGRSDLERRVLESLEAERERLVREVHDGPAQMLANAIFELDFVERIAERTPEGVRQELRSELNSLKAQFRSSLDGVRAMIYDLRPPVLSDLGLAGAMRAYLAEYQTRYGIKTTGELDVRATGLDPQQELAVYRIMQEALRNTQQHAQATSVRVEWKRDGWGAWILQSSDDGSGFDLVRAARDKRSVGLLSMRERAELIGGELDVRSAPGQGTTVTVRLTPRREGAP